MVNLRINYWILKYYGENRRYKELIFYKAIVKWYSGNLHKYQKQEISKKLGWKVQVIERLIRQMTKSGLLLKRGKGWHLLNYRKFFGLKQRESRKGKKLYGNKQYLIPFDLLDKDALSKLKTFYVTENLRKALGLSLKNRFRDSKGKKQDVNKGILRVSGIASLRFIKNAGSIDRHISTISRQLEKAIGYGWVSRKVHKEYLKDKSGNILLLDYNEAMCMANIIFNDSEKFYKVEKSWKFSNKSQFKYLLSHTVHRYFFLGYPVYGLDKNAKKNGNRNSV